MMKEKMTATEYSINLREQLRQQEMKYWQKLHPNAKVSLKKNEIVITYPLPKDVDLIAKFIKAL